jgi:hypothetical protein
VSLTGVIARLVSTQPTVTGGRQSAAIAVQTVAETPAVAV